MTRLSEQASFERYQRTSFFSSLDGLRCLSILAVIWHHTGIHGSQLSRQGHLGVDLFFVISGFLITTLLLREREKFGGISLRDFYIRRSLRIFPLYFTVILLYVIAVLIFDRDSRAGREFFANLPYFLTYTANWFVQLDGRVIFYFAWSLSTEEQFYLVWPTIEKFLRGWRVAAVIALVLAVQTLVKIMVPAGQLWAVILLSVHPAILGGVLLAHALHDRKVFEVVRPALAATWSAPLVLVGLVSVTALALPKPLIWTFMVLLVGTGAIRESNGLQALLQWRPVVHVGTVSYGMYLLHMLCYNAVKRALPGQEALWFPATAVVTVIVASISYRYYESYFLRLKARFSPHGTKRVARDMGEKSAS